MIAIVVPCLNESNRIETTCSSLGFASDRTPPDDVHLILVDNCSTDSTLRVLRQIRDQVGTRVHVATEVTRGHVPARVRGNEIAALIATEEGADPHQVVIVQCDADTTYSPSYARVMASAVFPDPEAVMATAIAGPDPDFERVFPALSAALKAIDEPFEHLHFRMPDIIVDDKSCAYSLAAYRRWGGHRREHRRDGSELLAETTRLFMAGLAFEARRVEVAEALAIHSQRRMIEDPAVHMAFAGFPYSRRPPVSTSVDALRLEHSLTTGRAVIPNELAELRTAHLVGMFVLLPAHVRRAISRLPPESARVRALLARMPRRTRDELVRAPGRLLDDVLEMVWGDRQALSGLAD
jgi:hypothetical protein